MESLHLINTYPPMHITYKHHISCKYIYSCETPCKFTCNYLGYLKLDLYHWRIYGEGCGGCTPPFGWKILPKKGQFWPFLGLQPPFPDRIVDKSSHERLQTPPLSKISRSAYVYDKNILQIN